MGLRENASNLSTRMQLRVKPGHLGSPPKLGEPPIGGESILKYLNNNSEQRNKTT